jgi:hypothetical protein
MMRRSATVVAGVVALTLAALVVPAHAGGKRLPKAVRLVEKLRQSAGQTHYVRSLSTKPTPAQSGVLRLDIPVNQSHFMREAPPDR